MDHMLGARADGSAAHRRRSSEEVLHDLRAAVLEQVETSGYASVTFAGIARTSGVGKPSLYRRFPDRATMVYDALMSTLDRFVPPAPTGSLRGDLIAWYSDARGRESDTRLEAYRGLLGEARPETLELIRESSWRVAVLLSSHVLEPARRAGELGPQALGPNVVYAPIRLLRDMVVFEGREVDMPGFVEEIALPLFRGASGWIPDGGGSARRS